MAATPDNPSATKKPSTFTGIRNRGKSASPRPSPWRPRGTCRSPIRRASPRRCALSRPIRTRSTTLHLQGKHGGGDQQRHLRYHPGPGQSRRAGLETGDGRQGRPVQAVRRHRRLRRGSDDPGPRRIHHRGEEHRRDVQGGTGSISRTSRAPSASSSKAPCRTCSTFRSSTTTSTAPRSSPPAGLINACQITGRASWRGRGSSSFSGAGAAGACRRWD